MNLILVLMSIVFIINSVSSTAMENACEGHMLNLDCGSGKVILIKNANYGRVDATTCPHPQISNQNCKSENSMNLLSHSCNNTQKCSIAASNGVFGDPCFGTYKYLRVQYDCVDDSPCKAEEFKCNNGSCISNNLISNGNNDCSFGEDELDTVLENACEGNTLNLDCGTGKVILIKNANYGRVDATTCPHSLISNQNCKSENSMGILSHSCNNKQKCSITATNGVFGDPCEGTYKYLSVQHECIDVHPCKAEEFKCGDGSCISEKLVLNGIKDCRYGEDEINADYFTALACEAEMMHISCKKDEIISIINANYGRLTSKICTHDAMKDQNCWAKSSLAVLRDRCNQKGSCEIQVSHTIFGDPCVGTYKYLEVHYQCLRVANCTTYEFQCNRGHCIDLSKKCDGHWDCEDGEDENGCDYLTEYACEHSQLNIECPGNKILHIVSANYGRQSRHICHYQPTTNCLAAVSKKIVADSCEGKKTCNIDAKNSQFGDPCVGTIKYLAVNFQCLYRKNIDIRFGVV